MQKAYSDCFLFLTKYFHQSGSKKLNKFLVFTYKELLKTFLSGRTSSNAINIKFFSQAFEQNPTFGWNFVKLLLKCILSLKTSKEAKEKKDSDGDSLMPPTSEDKQNKKKKGKKGDDDDDEGDGSRSNHQRL